MKKNINIMDFIYTLENKPIIKDKRGNFIVDLTRGTYDSRRKMKFKYHIYEVSKDYEMRPDLIAKYLYHNISYIDLVLKQMYISNPFSICEGDLIFVRDFYDIKSCFVNNKNLDIRDLIRKQYIDENKQEDKNIIIEKYNLKFALPPNFTKKDIKEIRYENGKVIYGDPEQYY